MNVSALSGGFADPARDAAHAFRAIMTAMARPGTIHEVAGAAPPGRISVAAGVVLLTLADADTPLWLAPALDAPDLRAWLDFHTGAPACGPERAAFALGPWEALPRDRLPLGTPEYPDRSATLIVEVADLANDGTRLTGPGIETEARLTLPEPAAFRANAARFPLGLDTILCAGTRLACIPRSTRIGDA